MGIIAILKDFAGAISRCLYLLLRTNQLTQIAIASQKLYTNVTEI